MILKRNNPFINEIGEQDIENRVADKIKENKAEYKFPAEFFDFPPRAGKFEVFSHFFHYASNSTELSKTNQII